MLTIGPDLTFPISHSKDSVLSLTSFFILNMIVSASPQFLGDLHPAPNGDNQANIFDVVTLINHINGSQTLSAEIEFFADINQDGVIDMDDVSLL